MTAARCHIAMHAVAGLAANGESMKFKWLKCNPPHLQGDVHGITIRCLVPTR